MKEDRRPGGALFKKSLRSWQAQYKAQKAGQASVSSDAVKCLSRELTS